MLTYIVFYLFASFSFAYNEFRRESKLGGEGIFATEFIQKNTLIWKYAKGVNV